MHSSWNNFTAETLHKEVVHSRLNGPLYAVVCCVWYYVEFFGLLESGKQLPASVPYNPGSVGARSDPGRLRRWTAQEQLGSTHSELEPIHHTASWYGWCTRANVWVLSLGGHEAHWSLCGTYIQHTHFLSVGRDTGFGEPAHGGLKRMRMLAFSVFWYQWLSTCTTSFYKTFDSTNPDPYRGSLQKRGWEPMTWNIHVWK